MKKILTFLLLSINSFAQIKEITITYNPLVIGNFINEETKKNNPDFAAQYNGIEDVINKKNIFLYFKDSVSIYKLEDKLKTDEQDESFIEFTADLISGGKNVYIKNTNINTLYYITELNEKKVTVIDNENSLEWNLLSESKQIENFKVYKATSFDKSRNKEIIAWYAPELPVSIGPMNYNNLPGLVLEIEIGNRLKFVAKKIDFKINEQIDFKVPMNNIISKKDFDVIINQKFDTIKNE